MSTLSIASIASLAPGPCSVALGEAQQRSRADDLAAHGWAQQDGFLPQELTRALAAECHALMARNALKLAEIGHGRQQTLQPTVRGDRIAWLKAGQSPPCDQYLALMENVRMMLNRHLYLGLDEYESHFACYSPGALYLPHLDRFRDDDCRTVSAVIYLNQDWLPDDGGALRLHPQGAAARDIAPLGSRLVLFLSADMLHEVLPATRNRISLAGWFRRRP
jgi:SM-20-related protein